MDYKKLGDKIYLRLDRGDEVILSILCVCKKERVLSATYSGIGGCGDVTVSTLIPEDNSFMPHNKTGLLEMISLNGNISADENNQIYSHAHAMFSYLNEKDELQFLGGHLTKAVISYTGEIVITPVKKGIIRRKQDNTTGITVWKLD